MNRKEGLKPSFFMQKIKKGQKINHKMLSLHPDGQVGGFHLLMTHFAQAIVKFEFTLDFF